MIKKFYGSEIGDQLQHIPGADRWRHFYPLSCSEENGAKFFVMEDRESEYCVNINQASQYDQKKKEFEYMQLLYEKNRLVPRPISFGVCHKTNLVFTKLEWLNGVPLDRELADSDLTTRYKYGNIVGYSLNKTHNCICTSGDKRWADFIMSRVKQATQKISRLDYLIEFLPLIRKCINRYSDLLRADRPRAVLVGDLKAEHMYLMHNQSIRFINVRHDYGDPLHELAQAVIKFRLRDIPLTVGLLDGYQAASCDIKFFQLLTFYIAVELYHQASLTDSDAGEISLDEISRICSEFDSFRSILPVWYKPNQLNVNRKKAFMW